MKSQELIDFLNQKFKPEYKESYDNVGFLLGDPKTELTGVLTTTDVTPAVVEEAIEKGVNLIVSHHPLIFNGLKRITPANSTGRMVMRLLEKGIAVYAAHTNLDNLQDGVNGILAKKLGLTDCHILRPIGTQAALLAASQLTIGAGMIGTLPSPVELDDFFTMVKDRLKLPVIRATHPAKNTCPSHSPLTPHSLLSHSTIKKVAICGGSGSFLIDDAKMAGADIYLTGDLKYHDFQSAEDDIILADIGHFESEQFAKELFYRAISEKFSNFACFISEQDKGFIKYI